MLSRFNPYIVVILMVFFVLCGCGNEPTLHQPTLSALSSQNSAHRDKAWHQLHMRGVHVAQIGQEITFTASVNRYFFKGSDRITAQGEVMLQDFLQFAQAYPVRSLNIVGYVGATRQSSVDERLALMRARVAAHWMAKHISVPLTMIRCSQNWPHQAMVGGAQRPQEPQMAFVINPLPRSHDA